MKNNKIILLGIAVSVLFTCCIWLAVLGSLDQKPDAPTQPPQAANPPTKAETYRQTIASNMELLASAFQLLGPLLENPKMNDDKWIMSTAASIATIRQAHENILKADPPPELVNTHSFLVDATDDCSRAMDFLADAIDRRNNDSANQAVDLIASCTQKLNKANEAAQKVH